MAVVGVLALQGSYNEHISGTRLSLRSCVLARCSFTDSVSWLWAALRRIGVNGVEVRKPEQLQGLDSLIIPGGESTTMAKLANYHNLVRASVSHTLNPHPLPLRSFKVGELGLDVLGVDESSARYLRNIIVS